MSQFLKANYHTHTYRCLHATGTEREYIEAAIEMGIEKLGFSDHIPCPFADEFVSRIRMRMSEVEEYVNTIRGLEREYASDIKIYVGFESEYIPEFFDSQKRLVRDLGVDYMIMGQHFLEPEYLGPYMGSMTDDESRIRDYVDSIIEGMETGEFKYLAHPDLIFYTGLDSVYEWEMSRLCNRMKELDIPLELNILGAIEDRNYPKRDFWKIAASVGNKVIVGIDAHKTEHMRDLQGYHKVMSFVDDYNLELVDDLDL